MIAAAVSISLFSLVILYFADIDLFQAQLLWFIVGIIGYVSVRKIGIELFRGLWPIWYALSLILLIIVLISPEVRGTHRWIQLYFIKIQPSEIIKPLIIVSVASYITSLAKYSLKELLAVLALGLIPFILVFKQPDLGNSIVYLSIYAVLLIVSPFTARYYLLPVVSGLAAMPFVWNRLAEYQRARIFTFINPEFDIQGAGYNVYQALIAVGSGGLFGKGLGQGTQSSLAFLPEFHTDFIFAATVEQLGFAGGALLLILYFALLFSILRIGIGQDMFTRLVVFGIFASIFAQVFINIGMNIGIVPITGITLPLFSFGGSSILAIYVSLGVVSALKQKKEHTIAIR